jgi:tetratricopeptide (TPR) repeat protein
MGIGFTTTNRAWLLIGILVVGCGIRAGAAENPPLSTGTPNTSLTTNALSADELRELLAQTAAEQRRRLDIVVAAHPDDLALRILRMEAEDKLLDSAAVVADSGLVMSNPSLTSHFRQLTLEMRAESLVHLHRFDESIAAANQALELDPSSAAALFARGWSRYFVDQNDGALADLDQALQIDPEEGIGYSRRATILRDQGKFDRAAKDFERAIQLAPNDGPSHRGYGVLLYQTDHLEQALAQLDAAATLMPRDPLAIDWRAQVNRALKRPGAVSADEKRMSELGISVEDLAGAHAEVGGVLASQHDYEGAAREFGRSLSLKFEPSVAINVARMQWSTGQFGQALALYREHAVSPLPSESEYTPLWLYVMRGRADPADEAAARADLALGWKAHQPHAWTDTLVDLILGRMTLESALVEADGAETDKLRAGRRCEADYYAAEQLLMHRQDEAASHLLEEAHRVCPSSYFEAQALDAELRLLQERSSAH